MTRERLLERDDELCRLILASEDETEVDRLTEEKCVIDLMLMAMQCQQTEERS
jgi:hypothetical protein